MSYDAREVEAALINYDPETSAARQRRLEARNRLAAAMLVESIEASEVDRQQSPLLPGVVVVLEGEM